MATNPISTKRNLWLPVAAAAFVVAACLAIVSLSVWREVALRDADLRNAETDMANMAKSLMQHAEDTVELAEATLRGLAGRLEQNGTASLQVAALQSFLDTRSDSLGRIHGLFVYDSSGRWLATTEKIDIEGLNNSDRAYFQHHRAYDDRKTIVGDPVRSRSGGQWIVTVSRRFNRADGSFGGVVLATVETDYFVRFYGQYDLGPNGSVALLNSKGLLVARTNDDGKLVGRDMSSTRLFQERIPLEKEAVYHFTSPLDGLNRVSAYRVSARYPLVLLATQAEVDVLARWRSGYAFRGGIVFALLVALSIVGFHLVRQLVARQRMASLLAAKEADFRLLAESSSDMVTRIGLDETLLYVSPSSRRIVGWEAAQLVSTPSLAGVDPEDLPRVKSLVSQLQDGSLAEGRVLYRSRHRMRGMIWLESSLRVTHSPDSGEVDGVVAVTRDMTEHKDLQLKLADLAATDALTGLANRRAFDERLEAEWEVARANRTSLSIIMIDVDFFKTFNDSYGHEAGDRCLQSVAKALASVINRPHDLVARYGGEEFAVLLPETDPNGCQTLAHEMRAAVAALDIVHGQNPAGRVSISLGGASSIPGPGGSTVTVVKSADAALYVAKRAGRNQVFVAPRLGHVA